MDGVATQQIALGGDGEFPQYRITAVIQLNNGDVLVAYDGRPTLNDTPGPNSILMRRSTDGGRTFGATSVIAAGQTQSPIHGYSDPSFVYDEVTGDLFVFFAASKDRGFWDSDYGHDDTDRTVLSAALAVSRDDGHTWELRSMTETVKPEGVRATFASSGHGIQIRRGPYQGRLVQQYAAAFRDGSVRAYSVYSDDHGETWTMGTPVGTTMDENKVVELSDGRLMMNSRTHYADKARWVAYSSDGGETWSEPELDHTLVDPNNNASIIRMNPDAAPDTREAQELLFSHANTADDRRNMSVRYSYDDGETWPVVVCIEPRHSEYSDMVALQDGTFGIFYEGPEYELTYRSFTREFLSPFRVHFSPARGVLESGGTTTVTCTLRNDDDRPLPAGTATAALPDGWAADSIAVPTLAPGESTQITLDLVAPTAVELGMVRGDVRLNAGSITVRGDLEVDVRRAATQPDHM